MEEELLPPAGTPQQATGGSPRAQTAGGEQQPAREELQRETKQRLQGDLRWAPPAVPVPSTAGAGDGAEHQMTARFLQGACRQAAEWLCREPGAAPGPTQAGSPETARVADPQSRGPQAPPPLPPSLSPEHVRPGEPAAPIEPAPGAAALRRGPCGSRRLAILVPVPACATSSAPDSPAAPPHSWPWLLPARNRPPPLPPTSRVAPLAASLASAPQRWGQGPS
nr:LOW QUALITY PROTEIN: putative uncharacterized protein MGC34800 [Macaca fascicularis]